MSGSQSARSSISNSSRGSHASRARRSSRGKKEHKKKTAPRIDMNDPPSPLKKIIKQIEKKQVKAKKKIKISEDDPFTNIFLQDS